MELYIMFYLISIVTVLAVIGIKKTTNDQNQSINNKSNKDCYNQNKNNSSDFICSANELKGVIGEEIIVDNIKKNLPIYKQIVQNIYIEENGNKTEIDIILITSTGIYVIESKNFMGGIYGSINSEKWKKYFNNKMYEFNNPIKQNNYHIKFLKKYLNKDFNYFKSYVVFGDKAKIKIVNHYQNIKVINNANLIENLIYDMHNSDICLSNEEIDKIFLDLKYFKEHSR